MKIVNTVELGEQDCIDLEVDDPNHRFIANDFVVSNSHSLSYSMMLAITAKLKFGYPLQFFKALLNRSREEPNPIEEIQSIQKELRYFNIQLLPPDLLKSGMGFTIEGNNIRFGLSSIKGISDKTIEHLNKFKTQYSTRFELFEAAKNAELSVGVLCSLIYAGALDSVKLNASRCSLALQALTWNILTPREKKRFMECAAEFDHNIFKIYEKLRNDGFIKPSRDETFKKKYLPFKAIYEQNSSQKELADYFYSMKFIGYSPTVELFQVFKKHFDDLRPIGEVLECMEKDRVQFVGRVIEKVISGKSKKGTQYGKWTVDDGTGTIDIRVFNTSKNDTLDQIKYAHGGKLPDKDSIVYVVGQKMEGNTVFANTVTDQCVKIHTKFADLKKEKDNEKPLPGETA